jgi:hypothetical protein
VARIVKYYLTQVFILENAEPMRIKCFD